MTMKVTKTSTKADRFYNIAEDFGVPSVRPFTIGGWFEVVDEGLRRTPFSVKNHSLAHGFFASVFLAHVDHISFFELHKALCLIRRVLSWGIDVIYRKNRG